jgi:hypothetical protein
MTAHKTGSTQLQPGRSSNSAGRSRFENNQRKSKGTPGPRAATDARPEQRPAPLDKDDTPRTALEVPRTPGKSRHELFAEVSLSAPMLGGVAAKPWAEKTMGGIGLNEALAVVQNKANAAADGDLHAAKAMLMAQAITLDAIFNDMARRAAGLIQTKPDGNWTFTAGTMDAVTRIAFKAQGQCRATLQTLGELVNPRSIAFIKQAPGSQANVANGPQQVNNGQAPGQPTTHAPNGETGANKLLEANPSERLDFGAQAAPGGANQVLEAVGAVNRAEDAGGTVRSLPKRNQAR